MFEITEMPEVYEYLTTAQHHVSEAEHEVKVALSALLRRDTMHIGDTRISKISTLRDAYRMLEEVYRMLESVKITEK